ncbi:hypothetical protein A3K72_00220 [Candidatus Woesearchaeota archaeon RBG_13_36_6]|nr:MAG: hypothetical protein A3K72_00220 [Candidatus Woesearchaeota archaeon RBG_13_36_6]
MIKANIKLDDDYGMVENVSPSYKKREVTCGYCRFKFKADFETKTPKSCPYCSRAYFADY